MAARKQGILCSSVAVSSLIFLLLSFMVVPSDSEIQKAPTNLNVGISMSLNTSPGRLSQEILEIAAEEINQDPSVLNGTRMLLNFVDSKENAYYAARAALDLFKANVIAVLGPQQSGASNLIAQIASQVHVPVVSFFASASSLSRLHYPYFTQVTFSELKQMKTIAGIVKYYGWKQVVTLSTTDSIGNIAIEVLNNELETFGAKIALKATFGKNFDKKSIASVLGKLVDSQSRIFILHMHGELGHNVLSVANSLGMITTGFVWIVTNDISNYLDQITYVDSDLSNEIQGLIGIRSLIPRSLKLRNLISRVSKEDAGHMLIDPRAVFAYDALWIIAHAVDKFLTEANANSSVKSFSWDPINCGFLPVGKEANTSMQELCVLRDGNLLLAQILGTNFSGITGLVKLDSNGDRSNPTFEIINFIGKGPRIVGYWSNESFFQTIHPYIQCDTNLCASSRKESLDDVIWPGGSSKPPSDGVSFSLNSNLRIVVPDKPGFGDFISVNTDASGKKFFTGFCIEVFETAVHRLPYNINYSYFTYGNGITSPNYDSLPQMVADKEYDAAVGDITITETRSSLVDFTQPYLSAGLAVVVTERHYSPNHTWAFLKPFSSALWVTILIIAILTSMIIWFLELRKNEHFQGPSKRRIVKNMLFILGTIFSSQSEDVNSVLGRIVFFIWLFVVLIITQSYTAYLTSILTVDSLGPSVDGLPAVLRRHWPLGFQGGSFVKEYMKNLGVQESQLKPLANLSTYASALYKGPANGGVVAIVDEMPYLQSFLSSNCDFQLCGQEFRNSGWGFVFPKGSMLAKDLSTAILTLSDSGELQRLHLKWLKQPQCDTARTDSNKLDAQAFSGVFIITGAVCTLAIICYVVLQCCSFHQIPQEENTEEGRPPFRNFSRYMRSFCAFLFQDVKEPDSIRKSVVSDSIQKSFVSESTECESNRVGINDDELEMEECYSHRER